MRRTAEQQELHDFVDALREVLGLHPMSWTQSEALRGNTRRKGK